MTTKFKPMACGFHSHCDQSLDGGSTVEAKILRADSLGRIADCLTDHGIMNGLGTHWFSTEKLAKDKKTSRKIQSIHGIEAYMIDDTREPTVTKGGKVEPKYVHLTIHFKTQAAYEYFCQLSPVMEERGIVRVGELKPLLKFEELEPISGQITIGSGCLVGAVQKNINDFSMTVEDRMHAAERQYDRLAELAGSKDNFFVEVFPHCVDENWKRPEFDKKDKKKILKQGYFEPILESYHVCGAHCDGVEHFVDECGNRTVKRDLQRFANQFVIDMARKRGHRILISEDSHFAAPEDYLVQEVRLGNGKERWKFKNSYHMGSSDEWAANLKEYLGVADRDIEEWIDNSYFFVEQFKDYKFKTAKEQTPLPTMEMVYGVTGKTTREKFWELVDKHGKMPPKDSPKYQIYKDRMDYELSVLVDNKKADFLPYFFVLEDAAEYARANEITFTCRGSAGGCLAMYLLNISITDPIKYDLPFERFLTLGRIDSGSLPDADTDWQGRDVILSYLTSKYGDRSAMISTNMLLRLKSSIKDVERAELGSVRPETEIMLKNIEGAGQGMSDKDWLFGYKDKTTGAKVPGFMEDKDDPYAEMLRKYSENNPRIWSSAMRCIGVTRGKGIHAGGVVITPTAVKNYFPLIKTDQGFATGFEMKAVENVGGVKYDFLALETLDSLGIALKSIRATTGVRLKWEEFPHDPEVYTEIIHKGQLAGIFQINTPTVRPYVLRIKPRSIEEIAATTALVRPGALDAPSPDPSDPYTGARKGSDSNIHAAEYFVRVKEGTKKAFYIHPDLEPILGDTFGVIVYQEQTLKIFRDLAGYTYEEAEPVRRGISKKDKETLELHLGVLKEKCLARGTGWTEAQVNHLCQSIIASSQYSFNKSHSVAYGMVAYNECWLKRHYPLHFWKGKLTVVTGKHEKLKKYLAECEVPILPIDVMNSDPSQWLIEGTALRPPLSMLGKVGMTAARHLNNFINYDLLKFMSMRIEDEKEETEVENEPIDDVG